MATKVAISGGHLVRYSRAWLRGGVSAVSGGDENTHGDATEVKGVLRNLRFTNGDLRLGVVDHFIRRCHGFKIKSERVYRCSVAVVPTVALMSKQDKSSIETVTAPSNSRILHNVEAP